MSPTIKTLLKKKVILFFFHFFLNANAQTTVTTLAGSGIGGNVDGPGNVARFAEPHGVAVDASGNVFVADFYNSKIRKITPSGVVSTIAGNGIGGYADGIGALAYFSHPSSLAVDAGGNIFVCDMSNNRIRKISPTGFVTTIAGNGAYAFADGNGAAASFYQPNALALDTSGNIYVADTNNNRIRKITPAGDVSTLAGSTAGFADGPVSVAKFDQPHGIAVDFSGNVFVADGDLIRKISVDGIVSTLAGGGLGFADGTGVGARFSFARGLATDSSGNIFVADYTNMRIRRVTPSGVVTTWAGNGNAGFADGTGTAAEFAIPFGVAVGTAGTIYVADALNNRIRKITGTLGTVDYPLENQISIYPNPTTSVINIGLKNLKSANAAIFDTNGQALQTNINVENKSAIDINDLASGIYLIQISASGSTVRKKIIKK